MYATGDIVKTRQSAPYDHVPGWRIVVAVEVPAEHSDLEQVSGQAPVVQTRGGPVPVLCRSFDHILCSKGDEPWAQAGRMNFAKKRCV
jgi:hypothetical protein